MAFQGIQTPYPIEIQQVIHGAGCRDANKKPLNRFLRSGTLRRVIERINKEEENTDLQKRNTTTGTIKISGLSRKRTKESYPRLDWEMFHNIYHM